MRHVPYPQTLAAIKIMKYTIGEEFFNKFDWGCYMEGYKEAAIILLNSLPDDQNKINRNIILPTLFLIRHFLELSFKEIICHEEFINNTEKPKKEHNLKNLWNIVKPKIKNTLEKNEKSKSNKYLFPYEPKIKKLNKLINFFEEYDSGSFSFRYPKGTDFKSSLIKKLEINLDELKTDFQTIQIFLSNLIIIYVLNDKYYE